MEYESKINHTKSLYLYEDTYHIWLSMSSNKIMDINVSDNVANTSFLAAEFDGYRYTIKNERAFNDVFLKAVKQRPTLVKMMFKFFSENIGEEDAIKDFKIKFTCFKRRFNIYIQKRIRDTKHLLWD